VESISTYQATNFQCVNIHFVASLVGSFMTVEYDAVVLWVMTLYHCFR